MALLVSIRRGPRQDVMDGGAAEGGDFDCLIPAAGREKEAKGEPTRVLRRV